MSAGRQLPRVESRIVRRQSSADEFVKHFPFIRRQMVFRLSQQFRKMGVVGRPIETGLIHDSGSSCLFHQRTRG